VIVSLAVCCVFFLLMNEGVSEPVGLWRENTPVAGSDNVLKNPVILFHYITGIFGGR
jgi:hypothetical protein